MLDARNIDPPPPEPDGEFGEWTGVSPRLTRAVAIALAALAAAGAYRGLMSVRKDQAGAGLLDPAALVQGKPIAAAPAVPLVHDPDWSTLKGPQILPPPVKRAPEEAETASDDAPDTADAADDGQQSPSPDETEEQDGQAADATARLNKPNPDAPAPAAAPDSPHIDARGRRIAPSP